MKEKKVIKLSNFPARLPIWQTVAMYLLLDKIQAAQWIWGAAGLFFLLGWIASIASMANQTSVDILNDPPKR